MFALMRSVLDFVHSNLQHHFLNNIEQIMFFSKKNISVYSTQQGLSKYVNIFERLYLNIRILAILSEMCTEYGVKTVYKIISLYLGMINYKRHVIL